MPKFVSLFSGAGGLDLGLEQAGWDSLYATDIDRRSVECLEANRGRQVGKAVRAFEHSILRQGDIRDLKGAKVLSDTGRTRGDIDLLAAGPPCQSWSSAGQQKGFDDPRGRLIKDYLRIAEELEPRWMLFENVRGLLTARGADGVPGSALALLRNELLRRGWQTKVDLLNAADHGVPQRRVRLFLLGYRTGDAPRLPASTHAQHPGQRARSWVSVRECLSALAPLAVEEVIRPREALAHQLERLMPGSGVKSPGKKETTRPGGHWGYQQGSFLCDLDLPARTVTASAQQDWVRDPIHGHRRLVPRECAALQTFPPGWALPGKGADQYRLVGNAVPPLLAKAIGKELRHAVETIEAVPPTRHRVVEPLPPKLQSAIVYTMKEERRNGPSRERAGSRRKVS